MKKEVTSVPFIIFVVVVSSSVFGGHKLINCIGEIWTMMVITIISLLFHFGLVLINKIKG